MASTSVSPSHLRKILGKDGFLAPALYISIAIAIFAVVTQLLAWTNAISLSTPLLTMWLVALGIIALLSIAYMTCRTYLTAKKPEKTPGEAGRPEPHTGTGEAGQARAKVVETEMQLAETVAKKVRAEQEAKDARDRADKAENNAHDAAGEAEQARTALADAEAQLVEVLAAEEAADWRRAHGTAA